MSTPTHTNKEALAAANDSATRLRDAISATWLIVRDCWHGAGTADKARNALDWITGQMDDECDALDEALEKLRRDLA